MVSWVGKGLGWEVHFLDRPIYQIVGARLRSISKLGLVLVVVAKRHFRVPLWSKPWTYDLKLGPN